MRHLCLLIVEITINTHIDIVADSRMNVKLFPFPFDPNTLSYYSVSSFEPDMRSLDPSRGRKVRTHTDLIRTGSR